jgi:phosphohistidine phosphatase SixA
MTSRTLPKTIIFVRHGIAVPAEDFAGPDAERPLTRKGEKKARKVFQRLLEHYAPSRIVTSPYKRALDTAALLQAAIEARGRSPVPIDRTEALLPDADWDGWHAYLGAAVAAGTFDADDVVVIVGHEPSLGVIFCRHIGFPEAIPFKKAGIGVLEPETLTRARLIAFAPARFFKS